MFLAAMLKNEVFIVTGCRTPIGSFRKSLAALTAPQLGSFTIKETVKRSGSPGLIVDEVFMGQVCQANCGQAPARQATLFAGLSKSIPCTTVNKVCASGMKSVMLASQTIVSGINNVVIAGGQESMSNVPFFMQRKDPGYGELKLIDGIVGDGLTDVYNKCHMGICAENTAEKLGISRAEQDEFARRSYELSRKAASSGIFTSEIVPVQIKVPRSSQVTEVTEDEEYARVNFDKFPTLKPAFKDNGTVTAANSSTLNDGAASMLVCSSEALAQYNWTPKARILGFSDAATDPIDFPIAPAESINKLLSRCNLKASDIDLWEINEAFSVVVLANMKLVKGMDMDKVNIHGGAVSIGHPIGMSGARITLHLAMILKPGQKGIASICNGGGGASSILLEGC